MHVDDCAAAGAHRHSFAPHLDDGRDDHDVIVHHVHDLDNHNGAGDVGFAEQRASRE